MALALFLSGSQARKPDRRAREWTQTPLVRTLHFRPHLLPGVTAYSMWVNTTFDRGYKKQKCRLDSCLECGGDGQACTCVGVTWCWHWSWAKSTSSSSPRATTAQEPWVYGLRNRGVEANLKMERQGTRRKFCHILPSFFPER